MKIAISSQGKALNSEVDPRFGRCLYFVIYDTTDSTWTIVDNTCLDSGGAGVAAAKMVIDANVDAVITGSVGPNAYFALEAANIIVYTGAAGTIEKLVDDFNNQRLQVTTQPTVTSHHGLDSDVTPSAVGP